jgi:hypothetical protein
MSKKKAELIAKAVRVERLSVPEKAEAETLSKPVAKHPTDVRVHKIRQSPKEA